MGFQPHHYKHLDGAQIHLINAVQYLAGVAEATGDPEHKALEAVARRLCLDVGIVHREALARWQHLHQSDPATFYAALRGQTNWPDEPLITVEPYCSCNDQCIFHTQEAPWATEANCNCDVVCVKHGVANQPEYAAPLLTNSLPDR